jgi:hypothetical protein
MPDSVQQQWLQQAANTLRSRTLTPWFGFSQRPLVVTLGYSIGGRRGKALFRAHPKNPADGINQDTIFFSPHAYVDAGSALDTLVRALITLKATANWYQRPRTCKAVIRSDIARYEMSPGIQSAVQSLEMFLPEFPPLGFDPHRRKQSSRMRLWYCTYHRRYPEGKVRAATNGLKVKCMIEVAGLPCNQMFVMQPHIIPRRKD